jgi:hypothetical protein
VDLKLVINFFLRFKLLTQQHLGYCAENAIRGLIGRERVPAQFLLFRFSIRTSSILRCDSNIRRETQSSANASQILFLANQTRLRPNLYVLANCEASSSVASWACGVTALLFLWCNGISREADFPRKDEDTKLQADFVPKKRGKYARV